MISASGSANTVDCFGATSSGTTTAGAAGAGGVATAAASGGACVGGAIVGSQSVHADQFGVHRVVDTGSWLARGWQGQGIGKEMRHAVLAFAFDGLGARFAESSSFLDNRASAGVSRALGYEENGRGWYAPRGESREMQRWRLAAETWRSRAHPEVHVEGLDACRDLFGA